MSISPDMRSKIVDEFNYIAEKMINADGFFKKIYYFSGTFGILQRIYNIEYDPELVFMHQILRNSFELINSKILANIQNTDRLMISDVIFEKLPDLVKAMAEEFEAGNKDGVRNKLQEITLLAYITTGNGFYLFDKGVIEI